MSPTPFPESTHKLLPSGREYSEAVSTVEPLHVFSDGEQCVSCWTPTPKEREAIAQGAHIWIHVLSGSTQPPIGPRVGFTFSDNVDPDQ